MRHKADRPQPFIDQLSVIDLVWFRRCLPDEEREKAIALLRAIQDRRWHEVWPEPIVVGEAQEEAYVTQMQFRQHTR